MVVLEWESSLLREREEEMNGSKLMMQDFLLFFVWFSNDVDVLLVGEVFLFKSPLFCTPLVEMNRHCTSSEMLQSGVLYTGHTFTHSPHTHRSSANQQLSSVMMLPIGFVFLF